ncbi:MAG: glycerophosphodiester phosphodiesterase [Clostridia bacterium]|nr:glycerophosphodiester phosphodiesterase [Clostridia bacterium]MDE7329242.1 glycerophosphodiester phosphodiesterase [Clostridia bacterium]
MITAHGGAMGTGRNTLAFFKHLDDYNVDAFEVDVWKKSGLLYLSHLPAFFGHYRKKLTLRYAFEVAKNSGLKINCDLKQPGIVKDVIALAKEVGMERLLIFTGCVRIEDGKYLDCGEAWFNSVGIKYVKENVKKIKELLDSYNNPHFAGINIRYKKINDEFLDECDKYGLRVSVFTLDSKWAISKYAKRINGNITTNRPLEVREIIESGEFI